MFRMREKMIGFFLVLACFCMTWGTVVLADDATLAQQGIIKSYVNSSTISFSAGGGIIYGDYLYLAWSSGAFNYGGLSGYSLSALNSGTAQNEVTPLFTPATSNDYYFLLPVFSDLTNQPMAVHNNRLYCLDNSNGSGKQRGIRVYDIEGSHAAAPVYLGKYAFSTGVTNYYSLKFIGDSLYVAAGNGIYTVDTSVTDPDAGEGTMGKGFQTFLAYPSDAGTPHPLDFEIDNSGKYAFVLFGNTSATNTDINARISVYQVSDGTRLYSKTYTRADANNVYDMACVGDYLYFSVNGGTLQNKMFAIDISQPTAVTDDSIREVLINGLPNSAFGVKSVRKMQVLGRYLLVAGNATTYMMDLMNPLNPEPLFPVSDPVSAGSVMSVVADASRIVSFTNVKGGNTAYVYGYSMTKDADNIYEAENMVLSNASAAYGPTDGSPGYVNNLLPGNSDSFLSLDYYAVTAGEKQLVVRCQQNAVDKKAKLIVSLNNNTVYNQILSRTTGFVDVSFPVTMIQGKNTIKISRGTLAAGEGTEAGNANLQINFIKLSKGYQGSKLNDILVYGNFKMTNSDTGAEIAGLPQSGTKVRLTTDVLKQKEGDGSIVMVYAFYSANKTLLDVSMVSNLFANQWDRKSMSAQMTVPEGTASVKAMAWKSIGSAIPISSPYER